jgi:predicted nucleotidyltransferase
VGISIDWLNQNWIEYEAIIGSHAYGLAHANSDVDFRGWFLPPTRMILSMQGVQDQRDYTQTGRDAVYYELQKFLRLASNGNPNILEVLWSPKVLQASPLALQLIDIRGAFLSQRLRNSHRGYANEQLKKMTNHSETPWKHAMHLLRVLMAGISAFETGQIMVEIPTEQERNFLRAVRAGEVNMFTFDNYKEMLLNRFDSVSQSGSLPPEPDYDKINEFLLDARYSALDRV